MSQSTTEAAREDKLEMTFVVGGEEFTSEAEAREYINEQQVQNGAEAAANILCEVFGPDAVDAAEDYFGVPFEMMVRATVDAPNSLVNNYSTETPRILGGQTIATIGRKVTQSTEFDN